MKNYFLTNKALRKRNEKLLKELEIRQKFLMASEARCDKYSAMIKDLEKEKGQLCDKLCAIAFKNENRRG